MGAYRMTKMTSCKRNEVRTDMAMTSKTKISFDRVGRVAVVAVLALLMMLAATSADAQTACLSDGDYLLGSSSSNGEELIISVGGTPGINFTVGDTILFEWKTKTADDYSQGFKINDSQNNKIIDKAPMTQSGPDGNGFYTYSYTWNSSGAAADFYAVEVRDASGTYKAASFFTLGSPAVGMWFYSDAARTNQTDVFALNDTIYAKVVISASENTLKKLEIDDFFGNKADSSAGDFNVNITQTGTTWLFDFPADFTDPNLTNFGDGDWGFIKWQGNTVADRLQRTIKRADAGCTVCTETQTVALDEPIPDPITGPTTISATGSAGTSNVQVSDDNATWHASPWTYTPPSGSTGTVTFYAQATGDCGTVSDPTPVTVNYDTTDAVPPTVTAFTVPSPQTTQNVSISTFTATDNVAVTGYLVNESAATPSASDPNWSGTAPATYNVGSDGTKTLYAWAKDGAGNVSSSMSATVTVDSTGPSVTSTVPANGAVDVNPDSSVTINWNEAVDCATVTTSTVTISPAVSWTLSSCSGSQAVFSPSGQATSTSYTVTVGTGVKDSLGNAMASAYNFSYTTSACVDSTPSSVNIPAGQSVRGTCIDLTSLHGPVNGNGTVTKYYINGVDKTSVASCWDSVADGLGDPREYVTFRVEGTDPDCGGTTWYNEVTDLEVNNEPIQWQISHCSDCHKYPPADAADMNSDGEPDRNYPTGAVLGAHAAHVNTATDPPSSGKADCDTCHVMPQTSPTPDYGHSDGAIDMATSIAGGVYNPGGGRTNPMPQDANVTFADMGACTNTNCHGVTSPNWGDPNASITCTSCHGQPPDGSSFPNTNGSHSAHFNQTVEGGRPITDCSSPACHQKPTLADLWASPHMNGVADQGCDTSLCHNNTTVLSSSAKTNPNINLSPTWGVDSYACDMCHDVPPTNSTVQQHATTDTTCTDCHPHDGTGSPATHINNQLDVTALACNACHGYPPVTKHASGTTAVVHNSTAAFLNAHNDCEVCHLTKDDGTGNHQPTSPYTEAANHRNSKITMNSGTQYNSGNNGCDNACHPNNATYQMSSAGITVETLAGFSPVRCDDCHGYPPLADGSANDKHVAGATPVDHEKISNDNGATLLAEHLDCEKCHGTKEDGTMQGHSPNANYNVASDHKNGSINMNTLGTAYNPTNFGCDAACHANDANHQLSDSGLPVADGDYGGAGGPCDNCHTTAQGSRRAVFSDFNQASRHVFGGTVTPFDCIVCHGEGDENSGSNPNTASNGKHMNGVVDMRDVDTVTTSYTWNGSEYSNMDTFCMTCHDSDGASGIAVVGNGTAVTTSPTTQEALAPFNDTDGGYGNLGASSPSNQTTRTRVVDVFSQFATTNASHHAVRGQRYSSNDPNWSSTTFVNRTLKSGQNLQSVRETATLHCADCHTVDTNAHGGANIFMLTAGGTSNTNSTIDKTCTQCHNSGTYINGTGGRWDHKNERDVWGDGTASASNWDNSECLLCHGGGSADYNGMMEQFGGIHGMNNNDPRGNMPPYRFMGGSYLYPNPDGNNNWTGTASGPTCYTSTSGNSWAKCNKHDGRTGNKGWPYNYGRPTSY